MESAAVLISVLIFAVLMFLSVALFYSFRAVKARREVIGKLRKESSESLLLDCERLTGRGAGIRRRLLKAVGSLGNLVKPKKEKEISKTRKALLRCGYRQEKAPLTFFGFKALSGLLAVSLFLFLKLFITRPVPSTYFLFFIILSAAIGFYLPDIILHLKTGARKRELIENFPDALDLMVVCVEAGMGLDAAIKRVGEEIQLSSKVLSEEFRLLSLELMAGKLRRDALKNFSARIDLEDVNSFVNLLIQTDKFGTKIAQALRVYSDSMRTKRYQRAEEIASKLPTKLVFPLVLFIFPSLFITILGPAFIQLMRHFNR